MKTALQYKERINKDVSDIIAMLGPGYSKIEQFESVEVNQKIFDIFSCLGAIGSLADNDRPQSARDSVTGLTALRHTIRQFGNFSEAKVYYVDLWLSMVNSFAIGLDERKGPVKLSFNLDPIKAALDMSFEKGYWVMTLG